MFHLSLCVLSLSTKIMSLSRTQGPHHRGEREGRHPGGKPSHEILKHPFCRGKDHDRRDHENLPPLTQVHPRYGTGTVARPCANPVWTKDFSPNRKNKNKKSISRETRGRQGPRRSPFADPYSRDPLPRTTTKTGHKKRTVSVFPCGDWCDDFLGM